MSTALILLSEFKKTEIELWRPVAEAPGYEVSNLGGVRSFLGKKGLGGKKGFIGIRVSTPRPLKLTVKKPGYLVVSLQTPGGEKLFLVHSLVVRAFLPRPLDCDQVNHKNAIKADARLDNLEWSNHDHNHEHATVNRLRPSGERHGMAILSEVDVRAMRKLSAEGIGNVALAKQFHVSHYTAWQITTRRTWKYVE